jgi:hypothetical protein
MTADPVQLTPAKRKRFRHFFRPLMVGLADRSKLDGGKGVETLLIVAGFAAAANLYRTAEGLQDIGLLRSGKLASDWFGSLPAGRGAAYAAPPAELLSALCADPKAKKEIRQLLFDNDILGDKMLHLLETEPEKLGKALLPQRRSLSPGDGERQRLMRYIQSLDLSLKEIMVEGENAGI